jgi:hypothetical protein
LYDGPFCVLSIVDNHTFRRLVYEVLDHDPDHTDIERFFHTFQAAIQRRKLVLQGITTDGSALYPEPISKVFGEVPHQLCEFHAVKELTKAVLHAGAKIRKELAATKPALGRGRPSSAAACKAARKRKRIEKKVGDLFQHRYLFVQHMLTPAERRTLIRITAAGPNCGPFEASWTKSTDSSTVAAAATPPWRNWLGSGVGCGVSSGSARRCKSYSPPTWRKP